MARRCTQSLRRRQDQCAVPSGHRHEVHCGAARGPRREAGIPRIARRLLPQRPTLRQHHLQGPSRARRRLHRL